MARSGATDALEKFRFLVDFTLPDASIPTRVGFHDVQMPKRTTNKIMYREGQHPDTNSISAGLSAMEDIVMSRGTIAGDGALANDLYKWMRAVHQPNATDRGPNSANLAAADRGKNVYRSEITLKMLNREGVVVRAWKLYQAFPVNFVPGSDLNASEDGDKSLEQLTLCYEDFQELLVAAGVVGTTPL